MGPDIVPDHPSGIIPDALAAMGFPSSLGPKRGTAASRDVLP